MLIFKNEDIYDETANYIFGLTSSKELDLKKITILFQKNKYNPPDESIIDSLQVYYNTKNLTQKNVKPVDLKAKYNENILESNLKEDYKDEKNNLNTELVIEDLKELDPTIDYSSFEKFLEEEIKINNQQTNNINTFYSYVKTNFFNSTDDNF